MEFVVAVYEIFSCGTLLARLVVFVNRLGIKSRHFTIFFAFPNSCHLPRVTVVAGKEYMWGAMVGVVKCKGMAPWQSLTYSICIFNYAMHQVVPPYAAYDKYSV